ncbi:MAG: hypothetical protein K2Y39_00330 [Candidatus Obscuribacterales bacterium]|nr:hypothetical protein [Candidatus Obscuribacterales bacterium]
MGNGKFDSGASVASELARLEKEDADKSILRKAIDFVTEPYHHQGAARDKLQEAAAGGGNAQEAVQRSLAARQAESDAYHIASSAAKTLGIFTPGKIGFAVTGAAFALDEIRPGNGHEFLDGSLGVAKGIGMRTVLGRSAGAGDSVAVMSLKYGIGGRFIDSGLTRKNYVDESGNLTLDSFGRGLVTVTKNTGNPVALTTDLATAGLTMGLVKGAPNLFAGNTFRSMTTMGFANGWASGMSQEAQSQLQSGKFSGERLAAYPLAFGLANSLAAAPGNQRRFTQNHAWENAQTIRDREYKLVSIDAGDVRQILKGGSRGADVSIKPLGEFLKAGEAQTMNVRRESVPTDWITATTNLFKGKSAVGPAGDQIRFISRKGGDPAAPWEMTIDRGSHTFAELVKSNSGYYQGKDVLPLLKNFQEPLRGFLGSGSESGAFRTANGAVLKTASSLGPESIRNWGLVPHDAKLMFGQLHLNDVSGFNGRERNHSLGLQEVLKTPVTEAQAAALRNQMAKDGVSFHDYNKTLMGDQVSWAVDQVGINALGKTVMLDYGARYAYNHYEPTPPKQTGDK